VLLLGDLAALLCGAALTWQAGGWDRSPGAKLAPSGSVAGVLLCAAGAEPIKLLRHANEVLMVGAAHLMMS